MQASGGPVTDIVRELSYYKLFDVAEQARWSMSDIPWDQIRMDSVDERLISLVSGAMFGELTTFSATQAFMSLFRDDIDFTQWLSVWLYEETKHPHALAKWLSHVGRPLSATFVREGRVITPMTGSQVEMLTFNIISEVVAAMFYTHTAKVIAEPVLKIILHNLGKDEMRHSQGFEHYCKKLIRASDEPDKERIKCLRATWAFLHGDQFVEHPVFMTAHTISGFADPELIQKTRQMIRTQVTRRISGVVEIDIPDPDSVYGVLRSLRASRSQTPTST
jgi:hypothetical protein